MSRRFPYIYSVGLACPAGETFADAVAAYASGDYFFAKERSLIGADGLPMVVAKACSMDEPGGYARRLHRLVASAHADCLARVASIRTIRNFPMILVLPRWMKGKAVMKRFSQCLEDGPLDRVPTARIVFGDRINGMDALYKACAEIAEQGMGSTFVAAVDSYLYPELLDNLACQGMLLSKSNPYGFVPGEAAAVMFISHKAVAGSLRPLGRLAGLGMVAAENGPAVPGAIAGKELASSWRKALSYMYADMSFGRLIADLNGDRRRAEEFGYAVSSVGAAVGGLAADPEAPASYLGDLGSATGLVMAALALGPKPIRRWRDGVPVQEPEPPGGKLLTSLLSFSSGGPGLRAAALIEAPALQMPEIKP